MRSSLSIAIGAMIFVVVAWEGKAIGQDGPMVNVYPPDGTRFVQGQRFDIRVEGTGAAADQYSASLLIDGKPVPFTSGASDAVNTDGITSPGWGGFNVRGYSNKRPGLHTIQASFASSQGTTTVSSSFKIEAISPGRSASKPKNIIFLLGDGMGIGVRTATRVVLHGVSQGNPGGWLEMDRFPTQGYFTTHSLNHLYTDSAPGFSSFTTGTHNNNDTEGVFVAHMTNNFFQPRVEYMSEFLHRTQGKVTGIVTTADVEDATPGAMAVHTGDRNAGTGICDQYLQEGDVEGFGTYGTGLKVLMGGGRSWFLPAGAAGSSRTAATDYPELPADLVAAWGLPASSAGAVDTGRDLIADFEAAGFGYAPDLTTLDSLISRGLPAKLLGLFHLTNMNVAMDKIAYRRQVPTDGSIDVAGAKSPYAVVQDGFPDQPMLDEMAESALAVLSQYRKGFVLLIEGASIDKQEHLQDADRAIGDAIEFNRAIGVARRFAETDKETLVLVLSDHECGGFDPMGFLKDPTTGKIEGSLNYLNNLPSDANVLDPTVQPGRQKVVGNHFDKPAFGAHFFPKYTILDDGYPENYNVDGKILTIWGGGDRYEPWLSRPLPGSSGLGAWESKLGMFIRGQSLKTGKVPHGGSDVLISAYSWNHRIHGRFAGAYQNIDVFLKVLGASESGRKAFDSDNGSREGEADREDGDEN
jgi:alkaline phosphatase